jgi:outer membrane biosynthesis protein TonB
MLICLGVLLHSGTPAYATEYIEGNFKCVILDETAGTVEITGCSDSGLTTVRQTNSLIIPSTLNGYKVKGIGTGAFMVTGCQKYLQTVTLSEGIEYIGKNAFRQLSNLKTVNLPSTLTSIGQAAFGLCTSLTGITLPEHLETLSKECFKESGLQSITLPASLTVIKPDTFRECESLETIIFPENLKRFEGGAFWGTPWLAKKRNEREDHLVIVNQVVVDGRLCTGDLVIPDGVERIGGYAFYGTTESTISSSTVYGGADITSVTFPESVTQIDYYAFYNCKNLKTVNFTNSITEIEGAAFQNCSSLTEIKLPDNLEFLGPTAFSGCSNLTVTVPDSLPNLNKIHFEDMEEVTFNVVAGGDVYLYLTENNVTNNYVTYVYSTETTAEATTEEKTEKTTEVTAEATTEEKTEKATEVITEATTEEKTEKATEVITEATTEEKTEKNTEVTAGATTEEKTEKTTEVTIEATTEEKTEKATEVTTKATTEKTTETSTKSQWENYETGKTYNVSGGKYKVLSSKEVAYSGLANKTKTSITIPATIKLGNTSYKVTAIQKNACKGNSKLKKVTIGKNVKTVGDGAFMNCKALKMITFGAGVTTLGKNVLNGDKKIKTITFKGKKIKKIGKGTFHSVPKKATIIVPQNTSSKYKKLIKKAK